MKNIVYFLGAGCSKNFGYPLTGEIMPEILKNLREQDLFQLDSYRKTPGEKKSEKELLQFLYMLYPGLKYLDASKPEHVKQIPSITEILSLVDHFCFYNTPPHPFIADDRLLHFRELLNRAVVELILDYEMRSMTRDEERLFYKFIEPINHEKTNNKISIITTNYDLLIDWQFDNLLRRNKIDCGISYRDVNTSKIIFRDPDPRFHYYKLHGSLNWLRCDLCGQYYINPDGSIAALAFEDSLTDFNTCICSKKMRLKNVLVAPSIVRDIRDPNLLQIWKAALEAIRTADKLIFIGYSLPAEDLAIKSIIMRGLNGRRSNKKPAVEVVQHSENSKPNYINLFGKDIKYYAGGLQEYLK